VSRLVYLKLRRVRRLLRGCQRARWLKRNAPVRLL